MNRPPPPGAHGDRARPKRGVRAALIGLPPHAMAISAVPPAGADDRLARSSMDLLYKVLTQLLEDPDSTAPFNLLLGEILDLSAAKAGAIFVTTETGRQLVLLASSGRDERDRWVRFAHRQNLALPVQLSDVPELLDDPEDPTSQVLELWLTQGANGYGLLLLRLAGRGVPLAPATLEALRGQADYLASILYSTRRARLKLRHAQSEERAVIARELHDSLAQSLSYLKIQTSLLQSMLAPATGLPAGAAKVDATVRDLRSTLNVAYRQLRELITTFRLTMHGKTFAQALEDSIEEFEQRSSIAFDLDNRLPAGELSVAEEMQLLHIVREALCNVVRHSHASYCWLSVRLTEEGGIHVSVDDNGIGLQAVHDAEQHHGLIIMQERAHSLGGTLRMEPREENGTRVLLVCPRRREGHSTGTFDKPS
ncbi:MAG: histidine kinase [Chromatiales bacterium]